MGISEQSLPKAADLLKNKKELQWSLNMSKGDENCQILFEGQTVKIRGNAFRDMLKAELRYTNHMLKSFGVTELTDIHE